MIDNRDFDPNIDNDVLKSFGEEWKEFDYEDIELNDDLDLQFDSYANPIDFTSFDSGSSIAADFGAGSGRWTSRILKSFSHVYALEPSEGAFQVLSRKFSSNSRVTILKESIGKNSIEDASLDLAMCLGVLHHLPNTSQGIKDIAAKIKPGGFFLCYLYYKLDDKPLHYRFVFVGANLLRIIISNLPYSWRKLLAKIIAFIVYLPLAHISRTLFGWGCDTSNFPLHHYANLPFVMMQNDALDRFGTRLEHRFSKLEILEMLGSSGFDLTTLKFSEKEPYWTFSVVKN
jgi:SAM-dependent methyltransferase